MKFEIHITGDESIHETASQLGIKTIAILNLKPNGDLYSIHHMTSERRDFDSYEKCLEWTLLVKEKLEGIRAKIECPPHLEMMNKAIYAECHYQTTKLYNKYIKPTSINSSKTTKITTDRELRRWKFAEFCRAYTSLYRKLGMKIEVELCLYDDNIELDKKWMGLYV